MDLDALLTSPRWEILQIISKKPSSPVEIAEKLNTTVSYASQQLKLLDAAGLVTKNRTGAAQRGKPRMLFGISEELLYLTLLANDLSEKKLIPITDHHKTIVKIWMLLEPSLHYPIEKLYWKIEEDLDKIEGIFVEKNKIIFITESKTIKSKIEQIIKSLKKDIDFIFISKNQLKKVYSDEVSSLHDPNNFLAELKGGDNSNG